MALNIFNKKNKSEKSNCGSKGAVNPNGPVEIVSKNFTMTTNPNTKRLTSEDANVVSKAAEWTCWGCGHSCTEDICPVCGKKKTSR